MPGFEPSSSNVIGFIAICGFIGALQLGQLAFFLNHSKTQFLQKLW